MRKKRLLFICLACFFVFPSESLALNCNYTVNSVTGLLDAKNEIRSLNNNMTQDIIVCLKGGKYFLDNTISFGPDDSGTNGHDVVYKNYPDEEPIIIGGQRITNWQQHSGNIYKANVGSWRFYTLMENGVPCTSARHPNSGYLAVETVVDADTFIYESGKIPSFDYDDAQIYLKGGGVSRAEWWGEILPIVSINAGSREINVERHVEPFQKAPIWPKNRYYVRGSLDFLDEAGEYYLDQSAGYLYYWPRVSSIANREIIAPKVKRIIELKGVSVSSRVENIHFEGLTLQLSDSVGGYWHASFWGDSQYDIDEGLLYMRNARNIKVENCIFQNAGVDGISMHDYIQNVIINGNRIENIGRVGILLRGLEGGPDVPGDPDDNYVNKNNIISNNYLANGYLEYVDGSKLWFGDGVVHAAINLYQSGDNKIVHNEIIHWPYTGIHVASEQYSHIAIDYPCDAAPPNYNCWQYLHSRNNYIAFNEISYVMEDSEDGGGIYYRGGGRGGIIDNNRIHDIRSPVPGLEAANGIYLDDFACYATVKNNIIYNIGGSYGEAMTLKGPSNTVTNNIFVDNTVGRYGHPIDFFEAGSDTTDTDITKNIFYRQEGGYYLYYFYIWRSSRVDEVDRNLFYYPEGDYYVKMGHTGSTVDLADWQALGYDQHSIVADPKFIDRDNHNYRLQSDSPALKPPINFQQIDQSKIGLCGSPWNSKTNCPGLGAVSPTSTSTPAPSCPRRQEGNLNCDLAGLIDELDLAFLLANWDSSGGGSFLNTLLNNWKVK